MATKTIYAVVKRRHKGIGIAKPISPYCFRTTFVGDLLDTGADFSAAHQLAGHANVQTTARYDRHGDQAKKKAAPLLHIPYAGGGNREGGRAL